MEKQYVVTVTSVSSLRVSATSEAEATEKSQSLINKGDYLSLVEIHDKNLGWEATDAELEED